MILLTDTAMKKILFPMMIICHILLCALWPAAGYYGYQLNIPFGILCAGFLGFEVWMCLNDMYHDIFWYCAFTAAAALLAVLSWAGLDPDLILPGWGYAVLFLSAPLFNTLSILMRWLPETAVLVIAWIILLIMIVLRSRRKKHN